MVSGSSVFLLQLVSRSISFSDTTSGLNLAIHFTSRAGSHTPSVPTPPWWVFHCNTRRVVGVDGSVEGSEDEGFDPNTTFRTGLFAVFESFGATYTRYDADADASRSIS